jgi:hypothetical protein
MNDPAMKAMLLRAMGLDQASGNPVSAQGAFAPEMTDMAYDLPSMLGGIPQSTNAKGVPNPYNVESAAKYLNYAQDLTGSAGLGNNMLSWATGPQATDTSAWTPTKKGTGSPLTFDNLASMQAMAGSGGSDYQSFMADQMLKGATPAAALAALKKTIRSGQASQDLLDSMPAYQPSDAQAISGDAPDITNDQGFAQMYDTRTLLSEANDMHKGMAKDIALQGSAYKDPKTGQFYQGYEETPTEQMQAADKLGLAYPTTQYDNQDYISKMQQQLLGTNPAQAQVSDAMREQDIAGMKAQALVAKSTADRAQASQDELIKAWNANYQAPSQPTVGAGNPIRGLDQMRGQLPGTGGMSNTDIQNLLGGAENLSAVRPLQAGPRQLNAQGFVTTQKQPKTAADFTPGGIDPTATKTNSMPYVRINPDGSVSLSGPGNFAPSQGRLTGFGTDQLAGSVGPTSRALQGSDLQAARDFTKKKKQEAITAKYAPVQRARLNDEEMNRAQVATQMRYLASQGRTPLNDQLAARSQTIRNLIGL